MIDSVRYLSRVLKSEGAHRRSRPPAR